MRVLPLAELIAKREELEEVHSRLGMRIARLGAEQPEASEVLTAAQASVRRAISAIDDVVRHHEVWVDAAPAAQEAERPRRDALVRVMLQAIDRAGAHVRDAAAISEASGLV